MPLRECPKCRREGRYLEACSGTHVSYYRCYPPCNHVWCVSNDAPDAPPRDVSVSPEQRELYPVGLVARA